MTGSNGARGVITLTDVRLDNPRGGPPLLDGASLAVKAGEVVVVAGAAGVGTSRMVAAALGEIRSEFGALEVLGHRVDKLRRASLRLLRRRIGVVPQELCLLDDRSAQVNVMLPLEIDGVPRSASIARATQLLAQLDLESEASLPVDCLPSAARQRVAVARALVREPDLVIADHPTTMQDAYGAELVCTAIAIAAARGAACLVLGRDPALLALAHRHHWRRLALFDGRFHDLVDSGPIHVIETLDTAPSDANLLTFPLTEVGAA